MRNRIRRTFSLILADNFVAISTKTFAPFPLSAAFQVHTVDFWMLMSRGDIPIVSQRIAIKSTVQWRVGDKGPGGSEPMPRTFPKLLVCLLLASSLATASLLNGGFESGSSSPWEKIGYVSISTSLSYGAREVLADSGEYAMRLTASRYPLSDFVSQMSIDTDTLSASNGGVAPVPGALIWQSAVVTAGDTLEFRWNFVSEDELPYDDWAFYGVQFESNATQLTRIASVATVGPLPEVGPVISGWTTHRVTLPQSGTYTIYFGVVNALIYSSSPDLWIDNVSIESDTGPGSEVPEPATFVLLAPLAIALILRQRRAS